MDVTEIQWIATHSGGVDFRRIMLIEKDEKSAKIRVFYFMSLI